MRTLSTPLRVLYENKCNKKCIQSFGYTLKRRIGSFDFVKMWMKEEDKKKYNEENG